MSQLIDSLSLVPTSIHKSQMIVGLALPEYIQNLLGEDAINIIKAIGILVVGWIVALIAKSIIQGLLNKTDVDNKIASWVTGSDKKSDLPVEQWAGGAAFWFVMLFTAVAVLETLQLDAVYEPLNELLSEVTNFVPQLFGAALWLGIAWLVATIARLIVIKGLGSFNLDKRLNAETEGEEEIGVTETIGNALYWFIFFFFLTPILETLGLESTLTPLQGLVDEVLLIIPDLFAAVLIGVVGWFIAQIIRRLVTNLLKATGADKLGAKFGLTGTDGRQSLSWILGTLAYVFVLVPVAISALEVAQIEAISTPAIAMLDQVLTLFPKILGAAIILTLAYVVGEYVSEFVTSILTGFGFDNVLTWLGLDSFISATADEEEGKAAKTPSQVMGTVALVVILLIAALTAVDVLQIEALTIVVGVILAIAGQVLVALLIFALGLYFSNISYNALSASGTRQSKILGQAARIIILTLVGAMALEQMGIATNIVNLAFGLLSGGIAVAVAIAFGFGGREIAGEQLKGWLDSLKDD